MSLTVPLPHGSARVNDDMTWGQIAALYEARWRANVDPEHAHALISDVLTTYVEGWALTDAHGSPLAWPEDLARAPAADVLALHAAIIEMLRGGGIDLSEDAKAPTNPTSPGPAATSATRATSTRLTATRRPR